MQGGEQGRQELRGEAHGEQGRLVLSNDEGVQWRAQATPGGWHSQAKPWRRERMSHARALEDDGGRGSSGGARLGWAAKAAERYLCTTEMGSRRRPLSRGYIILSYGRFRNPVL